MTQGWRTKAQVQLVASWQRRGTMAWLLWPLSLIFRVLVALRHGLYRLGWARAEAVRVPVLVVGNVVAGGVGKTPVVLALVAHLQAQGWQVGVVARGHGRTTTDCREVLPSSLAEEVGDECLLIHLRSGAPVFVAHRRVEAAKALLAKYPATQVLVCDDGLQHLALHRDMEICVFDDRGLGNGFMLPAGLLREPWPRPLQSSSGCSAPVQWVLHTGAQPRFAGFRAQRTLADHAVRADGTTVALAELTEWAATNRVRLYAVAGIAQPEVFFNQLRHCGLRLAKTESLPDHYDFNSWKRPIDSGMQLICTEKDAVKLWRIDPQALAVPLSVALDPLLLAAVEKHLRATLSS